MKQLFVVDDTVILGKNLERHLDATQFSVIFCSNAQYALESFQQLENVDLVLVNPCMAMHRENRDNTVDFIAFLEQNIAPSKVRLLLPHQANELTVSTTFETWPKDEIVFERIVKFFQ